MKSKAVLSAFCAAGFAIVAYLTLLIFYEDALMLSLFGGLLFFLLLFGFLCIYAKIYSRRYKKAEKLLPSRVWYRLNGNIRSSRVIRNANVYFCDDCIVFLSLDKKPYLTETIPMSDIGTYSTSGITQLDISTSDGSVYQIRSAELAALFPLLRERGWILTN